MTRHGSTVTRWWIWYRILPRPRLTKYFGTLALYFGIVFLYLVLYFVFNLEAGGAAWRFGCTVMYVSDRWDQPCRSAAVTAVPLPPDCPSHHLIEMDIHGQHSIMCCSTRMRHPWCDSVEVQLIVLIQPTGHRAKVKELESERILDLRPRLHVSFIRLNKKPVTRQQTAGFSSRYDSLTFARSPVTVVPPAWFHMQSSAGMKEWSRTRPSDWACSFPPGLVNWSYE